ncbi:ferritin family protein [Chloroflexota bacterium]
MSISFSCGELFDIAINIEKRGIVFYDVMAKSTSGATVRDIFLHLADMERDHARIFGSMFGEIAKYQIPESYASEYAGYLQALVDSAVFTDDLVTSEMAAQADSDMKAIELAINVEKDSVLFYYEMRDIMPQKAQATVNNIIIEEKSHLRDLFQLKKKLVVS